MSTRNTPQSYGSAARLLHWLTAALILTAIGLGLYAEDMPADTSAAVAAKALVYSLHKTLGVAAFFSALARILWALTQPHPAPLHPERRLETWIATLIHWSLYVAMIAMPLSGWVHHAALDGFAPILWPFGQGLPFVPKSQGVAEAAGALHGLFSKLLIGSVLLHVAGALKHALIDRDHTLSRMLRGTSAGKGSAPRAPAFAAGLVYAAVGTLALILATGGDEPARAAIAPTPAATAGNWQVQSGSLGFTVRQMGAEVSGQLPDWHATITFDETPVNGVNGHVTVAIDLTRLTLGSVTDQAKGPEFFDTATHPTATFDADILPADTGYEAKGTLTLRGATVPVTLPFTLTTADNTATMTGATTLDRRAFGMGASYSDEATVGFVVEVTTTLTARRPE